MLVESIREGTVLPVLTNAMTVAVIVPADAEAAMTYRPSRRALLLVILAAGFPGG
jgi:hypothetical protein